MPPMLAFDRLLFVLLFLFTFGFARTTALALPVAECGPLLELTGKIEGEIHAMHGDLADFGP